MTGYDHVRWFTGPKENSRRSDEKARTELFRINRDSLDFLISIRDDPYWTSGNNSLELIELSSINKVSLV